ncbi:PAS domain-containing protein [Roseiterribacter gracilis]|uniref:PAS domain-containing protein n=1 Tax=Roseiterribacter gracilis TaxID=2812848 RepID=A0A8S8X811_9PROT|nr:hypothetical protein TMPK1_21850 [Rhodospirillales bacterium TMPK1]
MRLRLSRLLMATTIATGRDKSESAQQNWEDDGSVLPPFFRPLYRWWLDLQQAGDSPDAIPSKSQIDPNAIRAALAYIAMADIIREPKLDVRYRLAGSRLERLYGGPMTGRTLAELYPRAMVDETLGAYACVAETRRPLYTCRTFRLLRVQLGFDRLILPFASKADGEADTALTCLIPTSDEIREAGDWQRHATDYGPEAA